MYYIYILFKFPQIVLALHGLLLKKQAGSQDTLTSSPSADSTKKPGSISRKPKRSAVAKSQRYEDILKRCPPERRLRVKRVRADIVLHYAESVDHFLEWYRKHNRISCNSGNVDRAMSTYFDQLFEDGCTLSAAS